MPPDAPEPWNGFLHDVDHLLDSEIHVHCYGGFVVSMCYGFERPTGDVDFLDVSPRSSIPTLLAMAGKESALRRKHGVYFDYFGMVDHPDSYEERLSEMFAGIFRNLRLWALDPYDLALTKLNRNLPKDRDDVRYLARAVPLDLAVLRSRFEDEMKPYLWNAAPQELTLQSWIEDIEEIRARGV